jgi:hypothetical protein
MDSILLHAMHRSAARVAAPEARRPRPRVRRLTPADARGELR